MIHAAVFDLDGVIRHFDGAHASAVEARHGLQPGALAAAAFAPDLGQAAVTGGISRQVWVRRVGEEVGSPEAAAEWLGQPGEIDPAAVALLDELRASGLVVALLTNGTDEIPAELADGGIADAFDHVFNTANIGVAKPDPAIFAHVTEALGLEPPTIYFTDDRAANVEAAVAFGWNAALFAGVDGCRASIGDHRRAESGLS